MAFIHTVKMLLYPEHLQKKYTERFTVLCNFSEESAFSAEFTSDAEALLFEVGFYCILLKPAALYSM